MIVSFPTPLIFRYYLPLIYIPVPGGDLPDVNIPVRAGGRDHGTVRRPVALEQVLLEVVRVSLQYLHTSLAHTVRPHILVQGTCFIPEFWIWICKFFGLPDPNP